MVTGAQAEHGCFKNRRQCLTKKGFCRETLIFVVEPSSCYFCETFSVSNITRVPQNCVLGRFDRPLRNKSSLPKHKDYVLKNSCEKNVFQIALYCSTFFYVHIYKMTFICWFVFISSVSSVQSHVVMALSRGRLCATPGTTPSACAWTVSRIPSGSVAWIHVPVSVNKPLSLKYSFRANHII